MHLQDTIAAISTPIGEGGIGIVRLSGDQAIEIVDTFFQAASGTTLKDVTSHTLLYGSIVDPKTGRKIDEVLTTLLRRPRTYTREDTVEINCHGGIVALHQTLLLALESGCRLAEPGEFTKRAFLNGRIDLAQAEAVIDVIRSRTAVSLQIAMRQLEGRLSQKVTELREALLNVQAHLEAAIDFPEEDLSPFSGQHLQQEIERILRETDRLLDNAEGGQVYREGIKVAIVGRPNVGKSSLLNALARESKAIVTSIPGTTRDIIEEVVSIRGIPLRLRDTAGLGEPGDEIEQIGMELSRKSIQAADLVLYVADGSEPLAAEDLSIISEIKHKKTLAVVNKIDLPERIEEKRLRQVLEPEKLVRISALNGDGLDDLEQAVVDLVFAGKVFSLDDTLVSNVRHQHALNKTVENLKEATGAIANNFPEEITATAVKDALDSLGEIVGETVTEDLLDKIFSEFCIGK